MITEYLIRVSPAVASDERLLCDYISQKFGHNVNTIKGIRILKRSIDARQRNIFINLKVKVFVNEIPQGDDYEKVIYKDTSALKSVVVVGAGPAGLFASLKLIELGFRPILIERGMDVRERKKSIAQISRTHEVDENSNYCFGEGGAGAYSDGKLYTRSKKRGDTDKILRVFCQHGASLSILADAHPHIGTDKLPRVIENMRNTILECGGKVHFKTKMVSLIMRENEVVGVRALDLTDDAIREFMGPVILATGHSARDVYRYLDSEKVLLEPKGIAVGVRLEHPAMLIDQIQYHSKNGRGKYLPAAEYSFVTQVEDRGVYSFCMCPGGFVIPSATGPKQLVVNGMSPSGRNSKWSNSGMVVEVRPEDVEGDGALKMMEFQERLEHDCWLQGNMRQTAPAQRMADFVNSRLSYDLPDTSYTPGVISSPMHFWMPSFIVSRLQAGFRKFGRMSHGFLTNDAVLIGVETRTSSPIRILRDSTTLQHVNIRGLFPCGEGAGYAGGIVSAGIDGERCAEAVAVYLMS